MPGDGELAKSPAVAVPAQLSYGQSEKSLIQKLVQKCTFNGNLQPEVASATATGVFPVRKPKTTATKLPRRSGGQGRGAEKSVNGLFVRQMAGKDEQGDEAEDEAGDVILQLSAFGPGPAPPETEIA